jgi:hypothetical protein
MAVISDATFRTLVVVGIFAATFIAYANTFSNAFVWDDASSVLIHEDVKNARLAALFTKDQHAYGRGEGNFYRPLVSLSFVVDYLLTTWGQEPALNSFGVPDISPFLFHLTNTFWHGLAGVFLFVLLARSGAPRVVQVCVPLLYVVHPLHTEAVTYISGRADPMAAAFGFAGLYFVVRSRTGSRRILAAILAAACFALALLCKESALIFPVLALFFVLAGRTKSSGDDEQNRVGSPVPVLAASAIVAVVYIALRTTVLRFGSDSGSVTSGIGQRLVETLQAFALYVKLVFVPINFHMERTLNGVGLWVAVVGAVLLLLCIGVAAWAVRNKHSRIAIAILWFIVTWLPISGLFPLNAPMAEHWMYVPLAGFLWALIELVCLAVRSPRGRAGIAIATYAAGLCLIAVTIQRNQDWRTNGSIYEATLEDNPASIRVTYNLAVTYDDLLNNESGARRNYERVIELYQQKKASEAGESAEEMFWDEELESHFSLGRIYMQQQRFDIAASHFSTMLRVKPTESTKPLLERAAVGIVQSVMEMGRYDDAKQIVEQLKDRYPEISGELHALVERAPA